MTQTWKEELETKLIKKFGVKKSETLQKKYATAFRSHYMEDCSTSIAVIDIEQMEKTLN